MVLEYSAASFFNCFFPTLLPFEEEEEEEEEEDGSDVAEYGSVVCGFTSSDKRRTRDAMKLNNGEFWLEGFKGYLSCLIIFMYIYNIYREREREREREKGVGKK